MKFSDIKVVVIDIDGCLADGIYQISEKGVVAKSFYTRDFYGIEQLLRNDIKVVILSQSHDDVIYRQIQRICSHSDFWNECYEEKFKLCVFTGIDNKKEKVEDIFKLEEIEWNNVAYIGDAENDMECMDECLFSACPGDAIEDILFYVADSSTVGNGYISSFKGGRGAVYEICLKILKERRNENTTS
jgi:3-deoxy-D-manno-octulosonate 8-phosphate phosphatase (KDO 8-P phosphatase)